MLLPHLQAIQNKYSGKLIIYKINIDQEPILAQRLHVDPVQTILFLNSKDKYKTEFGYREYSDFEKLVIAYFFSK